MLDNKGNIQPAIFGLNCAALQTIQSDRPKRQDLWCARSYGSRIHQFLSIDYGKTPAQVYREALSYMLEKEIDNPPMLLIFLEYTMPLALQNPIRGLPSWVPDFSKNSTFFFNDRRDTWFGGIS